MIVKLYFCMKLYLQLSAAITIANDCLPAATPAELLFIDHTRDFYNCAHDIIIGTKLHFLYATEFCNRI